MCDVCNKNIKEKNYQKHLKAQKQLLNAGQIRKVHCSLCNIAFFR